MPGKAVCSWNKVMCLQIYHGTAVSAPPCLFDGPTPYMIGFLLPESAEGIIFRHII
jgi:hypothetical protein